MSNASSQSLDQTLDKELDEMSTFLKEFQLRVNQAASQVRGDIELERQQLEEEKKAFLREQKRHQELMRICEERTRANQDIVTLNVGGTKFTTTKTTLMAEEDTYLHALLRSGCWVPNESGEHFIDRNPRFFGAILDYLRAVADGQKGVELQVGELTPAERLMLCKDIEYFQIGSLLQAFPVPPAAASAQPLGDAAAAAAVPKDLLWRLDARTKGNNLTLSPEGLRATKSRGGHSLENSGVVGTLPLRAGVHRWRVALDTTGDKWILFGVSEGNHQDGQCFRKPDVHGWITNGYKGYRGEYPMLANAPHFQSRGSLIVDLELTCEGGYGRLTATSGGTCDFIEGIPLPVVPFFVLHNEGNSVAVDILA